MSPQVVGLHKDRFVFPVSLQVTQVSGSGVDAVFMGLIKVRQHSNACVRQAVVGNVPDTHQSAALWDTQQQLSAGWQWPAPVCQTGIDVPAVALQQQPLVGSVKHHVGSPATPCMRLMAALPKLRPY